MKVDLNGSGMKVIVLDSEGKEDEVSIRAPYFPVGRLSFDRPERAGNGAGEGFLPF
jgi:hypothetical protein